MQTVLALTAATFVTFALAGLVSPNGKLSPGIIQNATLAGGVTIGVLASTPLTAAGALSVGSAAGALSVYGFASVQPWLEEHGLHDTCGIHNLHGMPSVLGALVSIIMGLVQGASNFNPLVQLTGTVVTLLSAVVAGALSAYAMMLFGNENARGGHDELYWEVASDSESVAPPALSPAGSEGGEGGGNGGGGKGGGDVSGERSGGGGGRGGRGGGGRGEGERGEQDKVADDLADEEVCGEAGSGDGGGGDGGGGDGGGEDEGGEGGGGEGGGGEGAPNGSQHRLSKPGVGLRARAAIKSNVLTSPKVSPKPSPKSTLNSPSTLEV